MFSTGLFLSLYFIQHCGIHAQATCSLVVTWGIKFSQHAQTVCTRARLSFTLWKRYKVTSVEHEMITVYEAPMQSSYTKFKVLWGKKVLSIEVVIDQTVMVHVLLFKVQLWGRISFLLYGRKLIMMVGGVRLIIFSIMHFYGHSWYGIKNIIHKSCNHTASQCQNASCAP